MMEAEGSLSRRQRPATAGYHSRQRMQSNHRDDSDDRPFEDGFPAQQQQHAPSRPSTQRGTRTIPRASVEAVRRTPGHGTDEDALGKLRSEVEELRKKLRDADLAKSQAQVSRAT